MNLAAIVKTAFAAALMCEEHECRENFKFNDKTPFDPHKEIEL